MGWEEYHTSWRQAALPHFLQWYASHMPGEVWHAPVPVWTPVDQDLLEAEVASKIGTPMPAGAGEQLMHRRCWGYVLCEQWVAKGSLGEWVCPISGWEQDDTD